MKRQFLLLAVVAIALLQSCNTLYSTRLIDMEIVEPAKVIFPADLNQIAARYNNSNVSYNPYFARYSNGATVLTEPENNDSIASEIYYQSFIHQLKNSILFDTVHQVSPANYSGTEIDASGINKIDTTLTQVNDAALMAVPILAEMHTKYTQPPEPAKASIQLNPKYGLYNENDLKLIADSTGADLLLSLDYFSVYERCNYKSKINAYCFEYVFALWNFYNLKEKKLQYFYNRIDTISWIRTPFNDIKLPGREVAIMTAAEIAGQNFANFLAPHWVPVQRTFYKSGHIEMKKAEKLADDNKWLEAAEIWKKNTKNENKNIAAKSMFNLAVACEIEGDIDAALDWIVRSYHVFGEQNDVHEFNCREYLRILGQRKLDIKKIDLQFNPQNPEF